MEEHKMKKLSTIAGIMALVFFISILAGMSNMVIAQGCKDDHNGGGFWEDLTDEQREAVEAKMNELRNNNASLEEMRSAINEMLKGYGIEVPAEDSTGPHDPGCFGPGPGGFLKDLTDEQREAVEAKMKELHRQMASPEEVHSTINEMLKGYGIEVPAEDSIGPHGQGGFGPGPGGFWNDLTKEQREAVEAKMKELRNNNASPEEMRTAIDEMLRSYGIEVPAGGHRPMGFGPRRDDWGVGLTTEQRKAIREKIHDMRNQGATREEVKAAVDRMVKGYGVELPENSENQSAKTTQAENQITAGSYPNPFNPETQIAYTLSVAGNVRIRIYNIAGQLIRTFNKGYQSTGSYTVRWDGRDENNDITASGVYLYRIEADHYQVTNRMVLLK
jgi:Spy/CpxP family protein refolding chaperone